MTDLEDRAWCAVCGFELEAVRPGKHQHPGYTQAVCNRIASLEARLATAETDAERYRWLRDKHIQSDWGDGSITFRWQVPLHGGGSLESSTKLYRDSLDVAIDAAIHNSAVGYLGNVNGPGCDPDVL